MHNNIAIFDRQLYIFFFGSNATNTLHDLTGDTSHIFENFYRMSSVNFKYILNKIGPYISKSNTNMQECIPIK